MIYSKEEIDLALNNLVKHLSKVLEELKSNYLRLNELNLSVESPIQFFFKVKTNSKLESKLLEIILYHCTLAERASSNSFLKCFELTLESLRQIKNFQSFRERNLIKINELKTKSKFVTEKSILDLIEDISDSERIILALKEAINLAGFKGRIVLEKTNSNLLSLELTKGYQFNLTSEFNKDLTLLNPKVVVIDGLIDSVSEIHHLLTQNNLANEPLLLFARKFNDDVLNTLKVNFDKEKLRIVPVKVEYNLEGLNTLNDIAVISGNDLVSSLKGDLISSIEYSKLNRINKAIITQSNLILVSDSTKKSVSLHIRNLLEKREEKQDSEDYTELLDKRIRSLSSNQVIVRIPNSIDIINVQQTLDKALRMIKSAIDFGVIEYEGKITTTSSIITSIAMSIKCSNTINDLGSIIIDDTET